TLAQPATGDTMTIHRALRYLAPAWQEHDYPVQVYEHPDQPRQVQGASMGLAYLLASIRCVRKLVLEQIASIGDVWCTGAIIYTGSKPVLKEVALTQFKAKLTRFVDAQQTADRLFLVPEANISRDEYHFCRAHQVPVWSFTDFQ